MLSRLYVEALFADVELADQVWKTWDAGVIMDKLAASGWWFIVVNAAGCP